MRTTTPTIFLIVFSHLLLLIPEAWGATSFIPGQFIAKFSPSSEWSQVVVQASQLDPPDFTLFNPIISSLDSRINARVHPTQIFGDHRVLFSVDLEHLTNLLKTKLNHHQSVISAIELSPTTSHRMVSESAKYRVVFAPGSKEFKTTTPQNLSTNDSQLPSLLYSLKHDLQLPLLGEISQPGEAILWIDLAAFTQSLVDQLQSLPEVESAQPNYVLSYQ